MTGADGVGIAGIFQLHEFGTAFRPSEGVTLPSRGVIAVDILWDDIEVAGQNNRHFGGEKFGGTGAKPRHPADLVVEFRSRGWVAIGKIDGGDTNAADGGLHIAGLLILIITGQAAQHILDRQARGDGDPIIALLTMEDDIPADLGIEVCRKIHILRLGFLDQQHITAAGAQIIQDMVLPRLGGIHIPACDAHGSDRKGGAAAAGGGGVRVADGEIGAHQILHIIEFGIVDEFERDFVDHNLDIVADKAEIILGTGGVDAEFILEARASTAIHRHAEKAAVRLGLKHHGYALCRCRAQRELASDRRGRGGGDLGHAGLVTHASNMTACRMQIKRTGWASAPHHHREYDLRKTAPALTLPVPRTTVRIAEPCPLSTHQMLPKTASWRPMPVMARGRADGFMAKQNMARRQASLLPEHRFSATATESCIPPPFAS